MKFFRGRPNRTSFKFASIAATAGGDTEVVAAVAGKKIVPLHITLVQDAAVSVKFTDGPAGTDLTGALPIDANGGFSTPYCPIGHFQTSLGTALTLNLSGVANLGGWIVYLEND